MAAAAVLGHRSPAVAALLDAVCGFVVRRLRARHLNAMSRLDHTAQVRRCHRPFPPPLPPSALLLCPCFCDDCESGTAGEPFARLCAYVLGGVPPLRALQSCLLTCFEVVVQLLWSVALAGHITIVTPEILRAAASEVSS